MPVKICAVIRAGHDLQERRDPIERVVEDRRACAPARICDELGVGQSAHGVPQEADPCERVGLAREQQDRAADPRPVLDPGGGALRRAGRVEREAEQDEGRVGGVGLGGGEARDPATERLAADHDVRVVRHRRVERGECLFRLPTGQVDRRRIEPRARRPRTNGAIDAAVPLAPWPRKMRRLIVRG